VKTVRHRRPRATPPRPTSGGPGAILRRQREALRLTQTEVARRTGFSVPYISMLERGQRPLTAQVEPVLREALGLVEPLPIDRDRPPVPDGTTARLGAILSATEQAELGALARTLELSVGDVRRELAVLADSLAPAGMTVYDDGTHARLAPAREHRKLIEHFVRPRRHRLSSAALEVLAVAIAEGAITRKQVEDVRGVDCAGLLGNLVTTGFLWVNADESSPGQPNVYRPTLLVLEVFGNGAGTIEELREFLRPTPAPESEEPPTEEATS
jgi:segregation and condensation protein B